MTRREKRSRSLESQESSQEYKEKNVTRVVQEDLRRVIGERLADWKVRALRVVTPEDQQKFRKSLARMGLAGLLEYPWTVTFPGILRDIYLMKDSGKETKLRTKVELTVGQVAEVYSLGRKGISSWLKSRESWEGYFSQEEFSQTQGWKPEHCLDEELKQIFKFLTPILSPGRQKHVTKQLAATVIASYTQEQQIDWASIILNIICRQLGKLTPGTTTGVSTYLAHIYYFYELLDDHEKKDYRGAKDYWYTNAVELEQPMEHFSDHKEESNNEDEDNAVEENPAPGMASSISWKQGEQREASKTSKRSKKMVGIVESEHIGPDPPSLSTSLRRGPSPFVLLHRIKKDVESIYQYAEIFQALTNTLECDSSAILTEVRTRMDCLDSLRKEVIVLEKENRTLKEQNKKLKAQVNELSLKMPLKITPKVQSQALSLKSKSKVRSRESRL